MRRNGGLTVRVVGLFLHAGAGSGIVAAQGGGERMHFHGAALAFVDVG